MKQKNYILVIVFIVAACGVKSSMDYNYRPAIVETPNEVKYKIIDPNLFAKFSVASELPFQSDSVYFENLTLQNNNALTSSEVKYLSQEFLETDFSSQSLWDIRNFYKIDSIKNHGDYGMYVEMLDIGMMKESDAYIDQKIKIDDKTTLLLWYINYSTYEACPWATGTVLFGSVLYENALTSGTVVGESSGAADAPYWASTHTYGTISEFSIKLKKINKNGGEVDEEGNEIVESETTEYSLQITNGKWILLK